VRSASRYGDGESARSSKRGSTRESHRSDRPHSRAAESERVRSSASARSGEAWVRSKSERGLFKSTTLSALFGKSEDKRRRH
jgi:hypothetical protein